MNYRMALIAMAMAPLTLIACGESGDGGSAACGIDYKTRAESDFGKKDLDTMIEATARLNVAAIEIEDTVLDACNDISMSLGGMTAEDVPTACNNAKAEIKAVLDANPTVTISVAYTPAVCAVDASLAIDCAAECDASFSADATPPTCTGGELSVQCSATCMGSCTVEANAACEGSCRGQCSAMVNARCSGTCTGTCEGECSAMDSMGNCAGACEGTCMGMCDAEIEGTCMGSCMGSCTAEVNAECSGRCEGMCSGTYTEPRCEGGMLEIEASAECEAACESEASVEVTCTEPELSAEYSSTGVEDLNTLVMALERNLPKLISIGEQAEIVVMASTDLASSLGGAVSDAASTGVRAVACATEAVGVQASAVVSINVSIEASASVTACGSGTKEECSAQPMM